MRTTIALLLALLLLGTAAPSLGDEAPTLAIKLRLKMMPEEAAADRRMTRGKVLTIIGIIDLMIASSTWIAMAAIDAGCKTSRGCSNDSVQTTLPVAGIYSFSGALFTSIGAPMWALGRRDLRKLHGVTIQPTVGGLRVQF